MGVSILWGRWLQGQGQVPTQRWRLGSGKQPSPYQGASCSAECSVPAQQAPYQASSPQHPLPQPSDPHIVPIPLVTQDHSVSVTVKTPG